MTDTAATPNEPGPIDNSTMQPDIAAQRAREAGTATPAAPKAPQDAAPKPPTQSASSDADEQNDPEGSAASESGDATATTRKGVGKRIDELTGNWRAEQRAREAEQRAREAAERERDELRQRLEAREQGKPEPTRDTAQPPRPTGDGPKPRPTLEEFNFDAEAHAEAVADWKFDQREAQRAAQEREESSRKTLAEKVTAFRAEHPDFEDVALDPTLPITQHMAEAMQEADNPPALAYYLGQNREEAEQISRMNPIAQARAIGRIEAKIEAQSAPPPAADPTPPPKPAPVSKAPAPVKTIQATASAQKRPEDMSMAEYDAWRTRQEKAKVGR